MDIFVTTRALADRASASANDFADDVKKLWRASRVVCLGIVGVGVLRAVGPALVLQTLGKFVNAAIGARGVGVVTGEVHGYFWTMLAFIVVTFASFVAARKFTGLAESIIRRLVAVLEPLSLLAIAWPMLEGALSWVLILFLIRIPVKRPVPVAVLSAGICIVSLLTVGDVLAFTAARTMTIGSMLTVGGASLLFGLSVAARPYMSKLLT